MALLPDISVGAAGEEPKQQVDSIVRQVNEWSRMLSNEAITDIYRDTSNTPRILIGIAPDGEIDIGVSKEGEDITTLYT